ncbi:MAG: hemolysin activation protein [Prevotella sp.]|nr:hemolysin activation protein [Prevotella sp.]
MQEAKIDISVLIIFFNRPDTLRQVFDAVKKARPARLFLYQDGSRGERDDDKIAACRAIVDDSQIDWACEVHRKYQTRNYGCNPSCYMAHKWAFSQTDKLIVLEDDIVPAISFFRFCKELLDRYENDPRVWMIAGFNAEEKVDLRESYFFTSVFSIWGWASWKRVFDTWDATYSWMDDAEKCRRMEEIVKRKRLRSDFLPMCRDHKSAGKPFFESIFWASMLFNDALAIMSTQNQIRNIGISEDSTHFASTLKTMPRRLRRQFLMPAYEIAFPLVHPGKIEEYAPFKDAVYLRNAWNNPCRKVQYSLEELLLNLRYLRFKAIGKAVVNRLKKTFGLYRHA